jgi:homoserine dehydrogenase
MRNGIHPMILMDWDVRYKTALTSFAAFHAPVDPAEIPTYGIRNIAKEDIAFCHEHGYVCKLIGSGEERADSICHLWSVRSF